MVGGDATTTGRMAAGLVAVALSLVLTATLVAPAAAQGPPPPPPLPTPPPAPTPSTTIPEMRAAFPHAVPGSAAAWTGSEAYIFGGNVSSAQGRAIFRYDPATDMLQQMGAQLPLPLGQAGAFSDGTYVYVMGGYTETWGSCWTGTLVEWVLYLIGLGPYKGAPCAHHACLDDIHRYDPATDTLVTLGLSLPAAACGDVTWDGTYAHFFPSHIDLVGVPTLFQLGPGSFVFRFDPAAQTVQITTARMLSEWGAAVRTTNGTYYFGGTSLASAGPLNATRIYRFDDVNQTLLPVNATLPTNWWGSRAIWDGTRVHLMGGFGNSSSPGGRTDILTFDAINQTTGTYSLELPHASTAMSTVSTGTDGYVFGGEVGTFSRIYCLHCPPVPPLLPPPLPPPWTPPVPTPTPTPTPPTPTPSPPNLQWGGGNNLPWTEVTSDFEPDWPNEAMPEAAVFVMREPCGDWDVAFDGSPSSDLDGTITSWTWEFDDGTGNEGRGAQRSFSGPGSYRVELTVTDDKGNMARKVVEITLTDCPPAEASSTKSTGEEDGTADDNGGIVGAQPDLDPGADPDQQPEALDGTPSLRSVDGRLEVSRAPLWALMAMALGLLLLMLVAYRRRRKDDEAS